jgi:hypothetical protein
MVAEFGYQFNGTDFVGQDSVRYYWSGTRGGDFQSSTTIDLLYYFPNSSMPLTEYDLLLPYLETLHYDSLEGYKWRTSSGAFDSLQYRTINNLNASGYATTSTDYGFWSGVWKPSTKELKTYSPSGHLTSFLNQDWDGALWENYNRVSINYNTADKRSEVLNEEWNLGSMSWDKTHRFTYTFTGNDMTASTEQEWNTATMSWDNNRRQLFTYDNGRVVSAVYQQWNEDSAKWLNDNRTVVTYNSSGQIEYMTAQDWEHASQSWKNDDRRVLTYDASGNLSSMTMFSWNAGSWNPEVRILYTYTTSSNGSSTTLVMQVWDTGLPNPDWVNVARVTLEYNEYDQITLLGRESWNGSAWGGVSGDSRFTFLYETFDDGTTNAVGNVNRQVGFRYFPNPAKDMLRVECPNGAIDQVWIMDMTGRTVLSQPTPQRPGGITISTTDLAAGMYLLRVQHNGRTETVPLSIQ